MYQEALKMNSILLTFFALLIRWHEETISDCTYWLVWSAF